MTKIPYIVSELNKYNFNENSLNGFERYQEVNVCWRMSASGYVLTPVHYVEDWNAQELRDLARRILSELEGGAFACGAISNGKIVGFALLDGTPFGEFCSYATLSELYVSKPFRNMGIGGELFCRVCQKARLLGADKLYVSAHSAEESIAAYKNWGCVLAKEINRKLAEKEPFDLQLEFDLTSRNL